MNGKARKQALKAHKNPVKWLESISASAQQKPRKSSRLVENSKKIPTPEKVFPTLADIDTESDEYVEEKLGKEVEEPTPVIDILLCIVVKIFNFK